MKIGAVVVWYQPDKSVCFNIKSYAQYCDELYIIDNSENENEHLLPNRKAKYVSLHENKGIAYALNYGIKMALEDGCDWVLTMDQDSSFDNRIIDVYKKYILEHNTQDVAILCPQYRTDRADLQPKGQFNSKEYVMQSANLMNMKIYKEVGGFVDELFIDCVDYEYCLRVRKQNYKIIECTDAVLAHQPAETKSVRILWKTIKYGLASPLRYYYQIRNLRYLIHKYHNMKMLLILFMKVAKILLLFVNKKEYLRAVKAANYDYKHKNFGRKDGI